MTAPRHDVRARRTRPGATPVRVSAAAVLGRARADLGPVCAAALVVALAAGVASAVPRLMAGTADDAVRYAVSSAGADAELSTLRPLRESLREQRVLRVDLAAGLDGLAGEVQTEMADVLSDVLQSPVTTVATSVLAPVTPADGDLHTVRMYHLGQEPNAVEWVSGHPGRATLTGDEALRWDEERDAWPVAAAVSVDVAADLGLAVGDHLALQNENRSVHVDLVVSGIFRVRDPADPVWSHAPEVVTPRAVGSVLTRRTQVAVLLSDDALPIAVRAMPAGSTTATVTFAPDPTAFRAEQVPEVVAAIAGLQADALASASDSGFYTAANEVQTDLDGVLTTAYDRTRAGAAQAWVLLAGILTTLGLTLVLTARLLLQRRSDVLLTYRARGATAAGLATELATESVLLAGVGSGAGLWLAALAVPGPTPWAWVLPVTVVAAAAPPTLAVWHVVHRTRGSRRAANRHDRRVLARDRVAARVLAEVALAVVAVGAVAALRVRHVGAAGPDPLTTLAPTLAAAAAGVLLVHLVPALLRWSMAHARRSRRTGGLLATARAQATGTAALPFVTVTLAAALAGLAATVTATVAVGQEQASWEVLGAEAFVESDPDPSVAAVAAELDARSDVVAVPGVVDDAQLFGAHGDGLVEVVALPADAYAALVGGTPLPPVPEVARLTEADAARLPVLVSSGLRPPDPSVSLLWDGVSVEATVVGVAPPTFGDGDVVVVDMAAFEEATGVTVAPDRIWLTGPGAERAAVSTPALAGSDVRLRSEWLRTARSDPLAVGLARGTRAGALLLAALAAVAVVLATSATAPGRATTLAMLSTLGLDGRSARRVSAGELLPGVALAGVTGAGCGVALALLVVAPLGLRLVTGQPTDPQVVLSGWLVAPPILAVVTVVVLVGVESLGWRPARVGAVLRTGAR